MNTAPSNTYTASGNVEPHVFTALSADNTVVQANASSIPNGISAGGAQDFPDNLVSGTQYRATDGRPVPVFQIGDFCWLRIGTGGCSAGSKLKVDANGRGIVTTTTADKYFAVAQSANASGELAWVQIIGQAVV